jgi:hypothetical protein
LLAIGSHSISATYNGDANFLTSTSAARIFEVARLGDHGLGGRCLRSGTPVPGELLTFAATVTSGRRLTSAITFTTAPSSSEPRRSIPGDAIVTARLAIGVHTITATYEGDLDTRPPRPPRSF